MEDLAIYLIYAKDCNDCEEMKNTLLDILVEKSIKSYELIEYNSESDDAINLAIENDINDIPACIIGTFTFCGKNGWNYEDLEIAIEKTLEESYGSNQRND